MLAASGGLVSALPIVPIPSCPPLGPLDTICQAADGVGSSIAGAGAGAILDAVASWVVNGASWLLGQIGNVIDATTSIDVRAGWFESHYAVMAGLAAVVILPLLLASVFQAIYRQNAAVLARSFLVHLPLALLLTFAAAQLVQFALAATDALSSTVASHSGTDIHSALSGLANAMANQAAGGDPGAPTFVVLLGALLVTFGSLGLWIELLVRAAAVYAAALFLPLALASLVWPSISHWCRRLVETLVALILSKFVIVAILSLAVGALAPSSDASISATLAGGSLLLLAAFSPFTLLRLVPLVEAGAIQHLEGVRRRITHPAAALPQTAASYALRALRAEPLELGLPGTGGTHPAESPGTDLGRLPGSPGSPGRGSDPSGAKDTATRQRARNSDPSWTLGAQSLSDESEGLAEHSASAVPMWRGLPPPDTTSVGPLAGDRGARTRPAIGPPPLLGGDSTGRVEGPGLPVVVPLPASSHAGTHVIDHDEFGPVIRWVSDPAPRPSREPDGLGNGGPRAG